MSSPIEPWLREILRCPVGRHPLLDDVDDRGQPVLVCDRDCGSPGQRRQYPFSGGIPVLLADQAAVVGVRGGEDGAAH
ncbi:MAG TPA: hypothetical protein VJ976_09505 [Ornithinimicrobium sp.]|uniref:Trm112 family protein n=1 Tax=Ornithinimicrobium sp. TaxID=1977084 RepID=UPI002B46AFE9|nr:hypothetical protein [Ornithinimicrobium sp.]HKJ12604.1 hypothetical protein [Ornithinimicrobium sp.]